LRLPALIGVFDHDAQSHLSGIVIDFAEDPHAGAVHFHDHVDALGDGE
jgi:hypothetical protein